MLKEDTLLVGFSNIHDKDAPVLIVGRKTMGEAIDIVNAFSGDEAKDIYERLVTRKDNNKDVKEALEYLDEVEKENNYVKNNS